MTGVLLGLSAAFFWGTSDFCAATVARKLGALRAILCTQSVGLFAIGVLLYCQGTIPQSATRVLGVMLAIGVAQSLAVFLFYRAFEIGKLSLVAPITSGFAVVTAILAILSGERPGRLALAGALLLVIGVLLVTSSHSQQNAKEEKSLRGIPEAICAAFLYGAVFWALDFVTPTLGAAWPLAVMRVVTLCGLGGVVLLSRFQKQNTEKQNAQELKAIIKISRAEKRDLIGPILAVAGADTLAWLSFNAGTRSDDVAIVTALASLYSAVAVFYGCVFWREKLLRAQWLGVGLILIGVLLVGVK